ncbi:hypothetical protein N781_02535 [Pontibacillus halophilus JSM 076056 = DSM 19796]|uniref:Uncharacterized protein n=1 Tax=Pontibacillus halophilus JSM 076056 = DSM 19796 TaxID=1385510 RepID=A0A0A5I8A6_9BACI|nr:hypothetical protein [Pontibacillus halophilus]KGX92057.1 hypothetical protein N781_02535 [Pontibacillus halophilus JSM 076056 = DSM 19796]
MILIIVATVLLYSLLMVTILAKLNDKRARSIVQLVKGNNVRSVKEKKAQYEHKLLTR